jgi:hypothetical protein
MPGRLVWEVQRRHADTVAQEAQALAQYANARCGFRYARGTLLEYWNLSAEAK